LVGILSVVKSIDGFKNSIKWRNAAFPTLSYTAHSSLISIGISALRKDWIPDLEIIYSFRDVLPKNKVHGCFNEYALFQIKRFSNPPLANSLIPAGDNPYLNCTIDNPGNFTLMNLTANSGTVKIFV
jgi:hypothetical protein